MDQAARSVTDVDGYILRLAMTAPTSEGYMFAAVICLLEAADQQSPLFTKDRALEPTRDSRKGGAILCTLYCAA